MMPADCQRVTGQAQTARLGKSARFKISPAHEGYSGPTQMLGPRTGKQNLDKKTEERRNEPKMGNPLVW